MQPPPSPGDATLLSLSCVDDDAQGQALDVLWEHELDAEIRGGENWGRLAERPVSGLLGTSCNRLVPACVLSIIVV